MSNFKLNGSECLGIEFGSTRIKAILIDDEFNVLATGSDSIGKTNLLKDIGPTALMIFGMVYNRHINHLMMNVKISFLLKSPRFLQ